jgi:hypothetical protein
MNGLEMVVANLLNKPPLPEKKKRLLETPI